MATDKVTADLAGNTASVHLDEAFKVYVAQLKRAQAKYPVGNPVHTAYVQTIAEVDKAYRYYLAASGK